MCQLSSWVKQEQVSFSAYGWDRTIQVISARQSLSQEDTSSAAGIAILAPRHSHQRKKDHGGKGKRRYALSTRVVPPSHLGGSMEQKQ